MRKIKLAMIALLCAATAFVTLGAVNSFTARANEETSDYVYQDTSVTSFSTKAGWDEMGYYWFHLSESDYANASGNYKNGGVYTSINELNTLSYIKIDGTAVGEGWSARDPYINLFDTNTFTFKADAFKTATEITVVAGCEFPSYALWSGTGNTVYRTTDDVTFVKNNGVWAKKVNYTYADTYAVSVSANTALVTYPRIELMYTDYKESNGGKGNFNNGKNYDTLYGLNTFTKIKIDGVAVNAIYDGKITDPHLNMYDNSVNRFAFKYENFPNVTEVVIEEGCEFPSYALWSGSGTLVYRMAETATFNKVDGVWVKQVSDDLTYRDTSVTSFSTIDGWDALGFYWFHLSENDYANASDNYKNGGVYTSINGLNTLSYIKIDGTAVGGNWSASDPYIHHYSEDAFTFKSEAFKTATEVTIEAGCEFPSYARWYAGASLVYKTTEAVTFRKVGDGWYQVYKATFLNENGEKIGENTFTVADEDLVYPDFTKEVGYDYTWTGNEIKAENITVTLKKTIKTFDVKIGDAEAVKYNYGTKIEKPETDPEKVADAEYTYAFAGWYNGETEWNFETDIVTDNVALTAHFDKTAIVYSLTFKKVDGTEITVEYTTLTRAEKLAELKAMLHTDDVQYSYTNTLPEELPLENGKTYEEKRTVKKYTVTIGDGTPEEVEYGEKLTKPATDPVKAEDEEYTYTFKGWYNGETEWNFETDIVTGNVTLVAKFNSVRKESESDSESSSETERVSETGSETGTETGSQTTDDSEVGGCFGSVASGISALSVLVVCAAILIKKKEN